MMRKEKTCFQNNILYQNRKYDFIDKNTIAVLIKRENTLRISSIWSKKRYKYARISFSVHYRLVERLCKTSITKKENMSRRKLLKNKRDLLLVTYHHCLQWSFTIAELIRNLTIWNLF